MPKSLKDIISPQKRLHFIGIGGCGMSAIAKVLLSRGHIVSGSDMKESANTIRLKELGAKIFIGHNARNLRNADIIIYSSAVKGDNPEIMEAQSKCLPVFGRAQMLGYLMSLYEESMAFAGTHGKTTTSSMMAVVLAYCELDPTFMIGGEVTDLQSNGNAGSSSYFVAEADESDGSITHLKPKYFILNNVEKDHMDHFSSLDEIVDLFVDTIQKTTDHPEHLVVINGDQWGNKIVLEKIQAQQGTNICTFGLESGNNLQASNIRYQGQGSKFTLTRDENVLGEIELAVPGEHNVLNSLPVIALALNFGLDFLKIKLALKTFTGAKRRFTLVGQAAGITIFDDYAHHPTEISATLQAARSAFPNARVVCAFQPHRYSRTLFFMNEFAQSLAEADRVMVTSIYGAGEAPMENVSGAKLAEKIDSRKVLFVEKKDDLVFRLVDELRPGDVFFTLGAGDIYSVAKEVYHRLINRSEGELSHNVVANENTRVCIA